VGLIDKLLGKEKFREKLSRLNLEEKSLKYDGIREGARVWYTPDGDVINLFYFDFPSDLPIGEPTIEAFCRKYRTIIEAREVEVKVVEVGIHKMVDLLVVRTIAKVPQTPHGMTYVGTYTIPFRDIYYVVKILCEERGTTGIREAIILQNKLTGGEMTIDDSDELPKLVGNLTSDDEIYDKDFPDHPLSRCRKGLNMIASSLTISEEIKRLPELDLPNPSIPVYENPNTVYEYTLTKNNIEVIDLLKSQLLKNFRHPIAVETEPGASTYPLTIKIYYITKKEELDRIVSFIDSFMQGQELNQARIEFWSAYDYGRLIKKVRLNC